MFDVVSPRLHPSDDEESIIEDRFFAIYYRSRQRNQPDTEQQSKRVKID